MVYCWLGEKHHEVTGRLYRLFDKVSRDLQKTHCDKASVARHHDTN
jgi:hypothetical protein